MSLQFREFTVDIDQRVLLRLGMPVHLAPKVFDTLLILVENSGRIVTKDELMSRLWPDSFVEEANLTFNIQQLRRTLGDNARNPIYIETIARRGYRFIARPEQVLHDSRSDDPLTERPEIASTPSVVGGLPEGAIATRESQLSIKLREQDLTATRASNATSRGMSRRSLILAAAWVIVIAGAGLLSWKFASRSDENPGENKEAERKSPVALPPKLEMLTGTGQSRLATISPDGKYLAYTRDFEKTTSIWVRQLASNTNVEIVPPTSFIFGLAFARSGEYFYFVNGEPTSLFRVPLLGGVPTRIAERLEGNFSISADDSQIAFIRQTIDSNGQQVFSLLIAKADGSDERPLLVRTYPDKLDVPVWAPDGSSIICAIGNSSGGSHDVRIVEVRVADGTNRELCAERFFSITSMVWLPHKSGLILSARKNTGDDSQLWQISYPRMEVSRITEGVTSYADLSLTADADKAVASEAIRISDIWVESSKDPRNLKKITPATDDFCWTPNGQLVYSSKASGSSDLWVMQADGSGQRQLTANCAENGTPAVTPDNRYIVFMSNRSGTFQVWRMNIDGSNQIQLTSGGAKNFPSTSPDGKWVLYNSTDNWHLWRVSIDGGQPSCLTEYLASVASVSPDGRMIACLGRNDLGGELIILPFEGGEPLKRFGVARLGFSGSRIQWARDGKSLLYAAVGNGETAIVRQALEGGPPEKLMDFSEDELFDFGYSFDRQLLAVTRGEWKYDIVLISDLFRR